MQHTTLTGKDLVLGKTVLLYVNEETGWWPAILRRIGETHHYYEVMGRDMVAKKPAPQDMTAYIEYARVCMREDLETIIADQIQRIVADIHLRLRATPTMG